MHWKNMLIGLTAVIFFSILYVIGVFSRADEQVFDFFLRFRAERERSSDVVFLDVDDNAIAHNGVFPWPRSITADSLLRLKEYGARAAIFDIEFIDKGPQGVDTIYLNQGLPADFNRSFSEIKSVTSSILSALESGRMGLRDIDNLSMDLSELINNEQRHLFTRAQSIARDNDLYLIRSSALFGKSWVTLNLRAEPLSGEQAERRSIAEEHFSYPLNAAPNTNRGEFIDVLPPLPGFALSAKGAGFTNVKIDDDGIRRRIYLAQNIYDHWYLQLAFAPLVDFLGNPEIELNNRMMVLKNADVPGKGIKDISIPLDGNARMVLDWPKQDYFYSYRHISFLEFSLLDDIEAEMEQYIRALETADTAFFDQFDSSLNRIPFIIGNLNSIYDAIQSAKAAAIEYCSEESFAEYLDLSGQSRNLVKDLLDIDPGGRVNALLPDLAEAFPEAEEAIRDEAGYIAMLADYIRIDLEKYEEISSRIKKEVNGKFCILGRVDTGTTDFGANPFWPKYVNVGTHGVVLDMILSETFITLLDRWWQILLALVFVPLFFLATTKLKPVPRAVAGFAATFILLVILMVVFRLTGIFFDPLIVVFSLISAAVVREIISYAGSEREKQFIRKAFSTYVSDEVVKEIIADPSRLQLGGTMRHMSAIFTDLQGFSTIAEKLDPENLVKLLNQYLTYMSDAVLEERGTIDKYEGDAIIAFFGAPVDLPDHAIRACTTAMAMKRIETGLNRKLMEEKLTPSPLLTRIGINTGSMVAGNMGTGNKMNYTIMGNAVNLAARLEGVNKQYGTWVLASDDTVRETGNRILTRKLDRVRVVGINEPVRLHELLNTADYALPEQVKLVEVFHQALDYFEKHRWAEAAEGFRESLHFEDRYQEAGGLKEDNLKGDGVKSSCPSAKYLERCKYYTVHPPKDSWDGVYSLTQK